MNTEKFHSLWKDKNLYEEDFIMKFGMNSPHWTFESDQKRELSLRHDMCCALLCNLEEASQKRKQEQSSDNDSNIKEKSIPKKIKLMSDGDDQIGMDETSEDDVLVIDEMDESFGSDSDSEEDCNNYDFVETKDGEQGKTFRYMLLEGNLKAAAIQNYYCDSFGIPRFHKTYDIVDTVKRLFIEVKISLNIKSKRREFEETDGDVIGTSLIVIHPEEFNIFQSDNMDKMPGEEKAINFLFRRRACMQELGISDSIIAEAMDISKTIFRSPYINMNMKSFEDQYKRHTTIVDLSDFSNEEHAKMEIIKPGKLFDMLEDPTEYEGEITKWKGTLTPPTETILTSCSHNDKESVGEFMTELLMSNLSFISGDKEQYDALMECLLKYSEEYATFSNFCFINLKDRSKHSVCPSLRKTLGIGHKRRVYNESAEGLKQPEYPELVKQKYGIWFEEVYRGLSQPHRFEGKTTNMLDIEKEDYTVLGRNFQYLIEQVMGNVGISNLGVMASQYINMGSRMAGTYLVGTSKKSSHSNISVMPLVCNLYDVNTKEPLRVSSGILFRGPHHARNANDNINVMIVERVSKTRQTFDYYSSFTLVEGGVYRYAIRRCAVKKNNALHLTFLNNSYFNALNLLGELVLNDKTIVNIEQLYGATAKILRNDASKKYLMSRVTESCLMAVIGNSRDEGYLAMARKLFMVMMAWRRGGQSFNWNVEEFATKMNECLIDNPLSMHLHLNFKYLLALYASEVNNKN